MNSNTKNNYTKEAEKLKLKEQYNKSTFESNLLNNSIVPQSQQNELINKLIRSQNNTININFKINRNSKYYKIFISTENFLKLINKENVRYEIIVIDNNKYIKTLGRFRLENENNLNENNLNENNKGKLIFMYELKNPDSQWSKNIVIKNFSEIDILSEPVYKRLKEIYNKQQNDYYLNIIKDKDYIKLNKISILENDIKKFEEKLKKTNNNNKIIIIKKNLEKNLEIKNQLIEPLELNKQIKYLSYTLITILRPKIILPKINYIKILNSEPTEFIYCNKDGLLGFFKDSYIDYSFKDNKLYFLFPIYGYHKVKININEICFYASEKNFNNLQNNGKIINLNSISNKSVYLNFLHDESVLNFDYDSKFHSLFLDYILTKNKNSINNKKNCKIFISEKNYSILLNNKISKINSETILIKIDNNNYLKGDGYIDVKYIDGFIKLFFYYRELDEDFRILENISDICVVSDEIYNSLNKINLRSNSK